MSKKQEETVKKEDFEKLEKELEEVKGLSINLDNQLKRAVADYQNLEKRVAEGRSEINSWAVTNLLTRIAQVLHYFDQAFKGVSEQERESAWFKGVQMANLQLQQVLQSEGLEEIKADGLFDPALHEAVDTREPTSAEASAGKGEDGQILEIVEKGYKLNGRILKPARVIVGKKE